MRWRYVSQRCVKEEVDRCHSFMKIHVWKIERFKETHEATKLWINSFFFICNNMIVESLLLGVSCDVMSDKIFSVRKWVGKTSAFRSRARRIQQPGLIVSICSVAFDACYLYSVFTRFTWLCHHASVCAFDKKKCIRFTHIYLSGTRRKATS